MTKTQTILLAAIAAALGGCVTAGTQRASASRVDVDSHLVLASIAQERGEGESAAENYLAAARLSDDARFAEAAAELAHEYGLTELGLEAAILWRTLAPANPRVNQFMGIFQMRSGNVEAAVDEFEVILSSTENTGPALAFLMEFMAADTDPRTTTAVVARLVEIYPDTPEGHYGLARLSLRSGDYLLALDNAERAVELEPEWIEAQLLYARMLLVAGRTEEGLELAAEVVAERPELEFRLQYAELLLSAGRQEAARELLDEILEANPGLPEAVRALAFLTLTLEDFEASRQHFNELRGQPQYRDEAFFYLGRIDEAEDQPLQAFRSYSRVTSGSNAVEAQLRAANLLFTELSDQSGAILHLREFGIANPDFATQMLVAESELLLQLEREDEALQRFSESLQTRPDDLLLRDAHAQLFISIAQAEIDRSELDAAEDTLQSGLALYRDSRSLRYAQALLYQEQGRNRRSANALKDLVRDIPGDASLLNALGYLLTDRMDRHEEAFDYLEEALALEPDNPAIIDSMGWVLFHLGDLEGALTHLERAYELFPDPEVAAHIIDTQWALGNRDLALEMLRETLESNPESSHLTELEQRLPQ
ncbi:MAG TPA: tetratricopeptide repeat protein [Gammaproteobacteria bacterium]